MPLRPTAVRLVPVLHSPFDHGWGREAELLVLFFWLACMASYRGVSGVLPIPHSTVDDIIHRVTDKLLALKNQIFSFLPHSCCRFSARG